MKRLFSILFLGCSAALVCAQIPMTGAGPSQPTPTVNYSGPGDIVAGASAWWGLRAYNAAYAAPGNNPAAVVCDSATFLVCTTINILSTGAFDVSTASGSSSCVSTCVVKQLYDQSGNSRPISCSSSATCPILTFNCVNTSLPCLKTTTTGQILGASATITSTGTLTFSLVYDRAAGTGALAMIRENGTNNRIGTASGANSLIMTGGSSGTLTATANDAAWHAVQAVMAGASTVINVDGTETTGTVTGNTSTGSPQAWSSNTTNTLEMTEGGAWDNINFSSGQRTAMCHNQYVYWGTGTSC